MIDDHIPTCPACGNECVGEENPPSGFCDDCFHERLVLAVSKDIKRPADWEKRIRGDGILFEPAPEPTQEPIMKKRVKQTYLDREIRAQYDAGKTRTEITPIVDSTQEHVDTVLLDYIEERLNKIKESL